MKKWITFWNDEDGFSAKDFLMVLFCVLFALFLAIAFTVSLITGNLPAATLSVIGMMDIVIPTILAGVFGIQAVKEFKKQPDTEPTQQKIVDQADTYTDSTNQTSNLP